MRPHVTILAPRVASLCQPRLDLDNHVGPSPTCVPLACIPCRNCAHRVETISWAPRAFVHHKFLTHAECDHLIRLGERRVRCRPLAAPPILHVGNNARLRPRHACSGSPGPWLVPLVQVQAGPRPAAPGASARSSATEGGHNGPMPATLSRPASVPFDQYFPFFRAAWGGRCGALEAEGGSRVEGAVEGPQLGAHGRRAALSSLCARCARPAAALQVARSKVVDSQTGKFREDSVRTSYGGSFT